MGAGKTSIGRRLAHALNKPFFDSDKEIEQRTGANIPLIFELEGEVGFRSREKTVITELSRRNGIVLATGGGVVMDPDNRRQLDEHGLVIYLYTSVDEQLRRTRRDSNRPLLQTPNRRQRLEELLRLRDPLYREIADLVIHTDGCQIRRVVQKIMLSLESS